MGGSANPGPATVRGTLKVFFLLLVSVLVTTAGLAAVSLTFFAASVVLTISAGVAVSSSCGRQNTNHHLQCGLLL